MLWLLFVGRKKERKERERERKETANRWETFSPGQTHLAGCATQDFHGC
jgi:hypothetical protein